MAEDLRLTTIDTYNPATVDFVGYCAGISSRVEDIDRAFELALRKI